MANNNSPGSPIRQALSRASVVGVALAVGGIILFLILWVVLGQAGLDSLPRLIGSVCIPPAVIAGILGGYILLVRPSNKRD